MTRRPIIRMWFVRLMAFIALWAATCLPAAGFGMPEMDSQKFPVEVYGDYLEFRSKANQVVTKGRAFITYKDMRIAADTIQANTKTEDMFAQGSVDFWKGYDRTTGDFLVYNMKTGKGWMRDAEIRRNRNYFRAKDVFVSPAYSIAHDVLQTTCDDEKDPHYSLEAREVEIIPGHQMTMRDLALRWHGRTLYRKGLDRSSLFENDKFFTTRQGMSQIDGIYFKFATDLAITPESKGNFSYDYFQKRGYGVGMTGSFGAGSNSNGTFSLYSLNETQRGHKNTQMNLSHSYRSSRGDSVSTSVAYTGDKLTGLAENQDLNVQMNVTPVMQRMTMNITASKFFDLDGNKYTLDSGYQILNRVPEVNFSFPAYTTPGVPLTMNVSGMYGLYEEGNLDNKKNTTKREIRSNFTVPTVQVNRRFDFTPSYNFDKSWYSEGIERENGATTVRANQKFSKVTNLEFNYNISTQKGKSPFQFDSFTSTDVFSTRLRFAENTWNLNPVNFNYNRVTQRLEQVYWDYSRRSRSDAYRTWEFFMRRDYVPDPVPFGKMDMTRLTPGNMNMRYRLASSLWSFDTSITYPHEYRRITNTSMNYRAVIRPLWEVTANGNYNHLNKKFSPLTIGIVRDLHCWEARAEYNLEREEFWIEFYLKAYPQDTGRFRYGADTKRLEAKLAAYDQLTQRYDTFRR